MSKAIVYRFFDPKGELLYIGATTVGANRWGRHSVDQTWWPQVSSVTVEHFDSTAAAQAAEKAAIGSEAPIHNGTYMPHLTSHLPASPRRPVGLGSVYRSKTGHWVAQRSMGPRGARKLVRRYFHSRVDAERGLIALQK